MIILAVLKYCAIALQAAVEEKLRIVDDYIFDVKILTKIITKMKNIKSIILKRNNTIEDPEFKQALSDLNPDVIYEKLKVICKRNPKEKFLIWRQKVFKHGFWLVEWTFDSAKRNGDIQVRQSYQLIFFMILINLCARFHYSSWIIKWTITRNHSYIHTTRRPRNLFVPTYFWMLKDWSWQSNVLYGYNWTSSGHSKLFFIWKKSKMASLAKGKLGNRLNDDVILRNDWNDAREQQSILNLY